MKKTFLGFKSFFIFCLLMVSACKKNNIKVVEHKNKNISYIKNLSFKIGIHGIECKICAKDVIEKLKKIESIKNIDFVCENSNFQNCFIELFLKKNVKNFPFNELTNALNPNFKIIYISGEFLGHFKENKFYLYGTNNSFNVNRQINYEIKTDKLYLIEGILKLDQYSNFFYLSLFKLFFIN